MPNPRDRFRWQALTEIRDSLSSAIGWNRQPHPKNAARELRDVLDWMRNEKAQANLEALINSLESPD